MENKDIKTLYRVINKSEVETYKKPELLANNPAFNGAFCKQFYDKKNSFDFDKLSSTGKAQDESFLFFFESQVFANTYKEIIASDLSMPKEDFEIYEFNIPKDVLHLGVGRYTTFNGADTKPTLEIQNEYVIKLSDYKPEFMIGPAQDSNSSQANVCSYDPDSFYY